ncbi:hypothetical protein M513_11435 [Trichuris suis]|uniref:Uncharacterized protein n=1 Tax=Trichuris suis TaxID=68888 RepID=A0A085LRV6_9BILA|nr:hypothetical protein M513_11435 [Trichuris suis]
MTTRTYTAIVWLDISYFGSDGKITMPTASMEELGYSAVGRGVGRGTICTPLPGIGQTTTPFDEVEPAGGLMGLCPGVGQMTGPLGPSGSLLLGGGIVARGIYTSGIWLSRLLWVSREADEDDEDDEDDARIGLCGFAPGTSVVEEGVTEGQRQLLHKVIEHKQICRDDCTALSFWPIPESGQNCIPNQHSMKGVAPVKSNEDTIFNQNKNSGINCVRPDTEKKQRLSRIEAIVKE